MSLLLRTLAVIPTATVNMSCCCLHVSQLWLGWTSTQAVSKNCGGGNAATTAVLLRSRALNAILIFLSAIAKMLEASSCVTWRWQAAAAPGASLGVPHYTDAIIFAEGRLALRLLSTGLRAAAYCRTHHPAVPLHSEPTKVKG